MLLMHVYCDRLPVWSWLHIFGGVIICGTSVHESLHLFTCTWLADMLQSHKFLAYHKVQQLTKSGLADSVPSSV
jgi:hypothetical protein